MGYALDGESLIEAVAHGFAAKRTDVVDRVDRLVNSLDDEAGDAVLDNLRD